MLGNVIGVIFEDDGMEYAFKCFDDVSEGDFVVVDTRYGFKICKVTSIDYQGDFDISKGVKEVVCKVDTDKFYERKAKYERLGSLKKKMDAKVQELQSFAIYEMLAEKDPDLRDMLSEFKSLS